MAITDAPKIVTGRIGYDDSHTLERYLATGGYDGLRKALTMTPEAVAPRSTRPACSAGVVPGSRPAASGPCSARTRSPTWWSTATSREPATFKDHLLVERDPHQLDRGRA